MNILIVADNEEAGKIRSNIELEAGEKQDIRCFSEDTCYGAWKRVSANPFLYGILFIGRAITDRSDYSDAEAIQRIYSINPRILICMSTSKMFLPYEFCSIPCVCTIKTPVDREKIRSMLERLAKIETIRHSGPAAQVPLYDAEGVTMVPAASIRYARKVRNGLRVITECGSYFTRQKMDLFEKCVDKIFARCHGSYIVNLSHVTMLRGEWLKMDDGENIPVSRRYHMKVRRLLEEYHIFISPDIKKSCAKTSSDVK